MSRRDHQDRPLDANSNELYVMDADGSHPVRLTDNAASDAQPDFSPDGTKIVFRSNRDNVKCCIDPTTGMFLGTNGDIYEMKAESENASNIPVRLTKTEAIPGSGRDTNEQWPNYSPDDGTKIVFWRGGLDSGADGGASGHQSEFDSELYVMDLTYYTNGDPVTNPGQNITNTPTWGEIRPDWGPAPIKKKKKK